MVLSVVCEILCGLFCLKTLSRNPARTVCEGSCRIIYPQQLFRRGQVPKVPSQKPPAEPQKCRGRRTRAAWDTNLTHHQETTFLQYENMRPMLTLYSTLGALVMRQSLPRFALWYATQKSDSFACFWGPCGSKQGVMEFCRCVACLCS